MSNRNKEAFEQMRRLTIDAKNFYPDEDNERKGQCYLLQRLLEV